MAWLWRLFPLSRAAAVWWSWRNRRELGHWARFAWRVVPPTTGDRGDLIAEARLRVAIARDARTRGAASLRVRVIARTALLDGSLPPDVHDLVVAIAGRTKGIARIECSIRDRGRRKAPLGHPHPDVFPALPPPPSGAHSSVRSIS
jgi:hypothetical protein